MRLFEILLLLSLLASVIGFFISPKRRPAVLLYLPGLAVLFALVHILVEGYRFQMVIAYILAGILLLISAVQIRRHGKAEKQEFKGRKILGIVVACLGLLFFAAAALLPTLMPVVNLPEPSGPYAVGKATFHFVDKSRLETLTEDSEDYREFDAYVWYPAEPVKGSKVSAYKIHQPRVGSILEAGMDTVPGGPPDFVFSHFRLMKANSHPDAPVVSQADPFPVIGFSCGFLSDPDEYQIQFEELASHGYVVFSLNQPYESHSVIHPDGRVVPFTRAHAEEFHRCSKLALPLWEKFSETSDDKEREAIIREVLEAETFMDRVFRIRAADMKHAVYELARMDSGERDSPFRGKLDMSRLGVFGHSGGGAVAGQCCVTDPQFKAGVNMDGFQFGDVIDSEVYQPFMFMYSEQFADANAAMMRSFKKEVYAMTVKGSTHMDYSDNPYVLPISKRMGMSGKVPAKRMAQIVNSYLLSFFDKHLKGKPAPLLDGPSPDYPEVIFK
jgi:predicted dienelactone hydrolase